MTQKEIKEFIVLKEDVKHIKEDVKTTKDDVSNINATMTKLTSKLFNDDTTGEVGFFERTSKGIKRNDIRVTKLENLRAIGYGVVMVLGMIAGWYLKIFKR